MGSWGSMGSTGSMSPENVEPNEPFELDEPLAPYSWVTNSFSDQDITVASTRSPAIAISPAENDPVASLNQPMAYGPTKPPSVAMLLMNARPPAAASPVRKRVGIVQKIARADVIPESATVIQHNDSQKLAVAIARPRPAAAIRHASARFLILRPLRSTHAAHTIIATDATT